MTIGAPSSPDSPFVLSAGSLRVEVLPGAGMIVASLRRGSGPELLWIAGAPAPRPSQLGPRGAHSGATLAPLLIGGWFEMNPDSGLPAREDREPGYFHGEAVRRSWEVIEQGPVAIEAEITAWSERLHLRRRIEVFSDRVTATTTIRNLGAEPVPITPGEHPCFRRDVFAGGHLRAGGQWLDDRRFPDPIPRHPDGAQGNAMQSVPAGVVDLVAGSGRSIRMHVDAAAHDHVGFWWNFADHGSGTDGWDCLAIEPIRTEFALDPDEEFRASTVIQVDEEWAAP